jgi:coenzyme F420-0:L-glutamate ligase/coenzyme F420-1:gamma-L-glutamate ligase
MEKSGGSGFWETLELLVARNRLVVDRPKGSRHPRYPDLIYPLDYGYLEGTRAVDGGGVDVFIGSDMARRLTAVFMTVDLQKGDAELKLLLGCTSAEVEIVGAFVNQGDMYGWLVERQADRLGWLASRCSVREFLPGEIPREQIERLLEVATRAPSAHNRQPWRFAVVADAAARSKLAEGLGREFYDDLLHDGLDEADARRRMKRSVERILSAPVAILLCMDRSDLDTYPDQTRQEFEAIMAVQSVALAGGQLMLAAHAVGLGAYWKCAPLFAQQATRQALGLPDSWEPQALILMGRPAVEPPRKPRRPLSEVMRFI